MRHPAPAARAARRAAMAAVLALPGAACFATRQDVQLLRNDLAAAQAAGSRSDSARARENARLLDALGVVRDSVRALAARDQRFAGDTREALRSINEQLLQVQELTGQSQRRLQDLRASLEAREPTGAPATAPLPTPSASPTTASPPVTSTRSGTGGSSAGGSGSSPASGGGAGMAAPRGAAGAAAGRGTTAAAAPSGGTSSAPSTPASSSSAASSPPAGAPRGADADAEDAGAVERGPGPNELHKLALDQFRRGAWGTARAGFSDLLRRYPTADVAPEAQFYVAESYASERNLAAADEAYAGVVTRYPQSSRAPTALYKRARLKLAGNQRAEARALFDEVVRRYPRSDEAVLSRESLRVIDRAGASDGAR